jgi:hypothetical protein
MVIEFIWTKWHVYDPALGINENTPQFTTRRDAEDWLNEQN